MPPFPCLRMGEQTHAPCRRGGGPALQVMVMVEARTFWKPWILETFPEASLGSPCTQGFDGFSVWQTLPIIVVPVLGNLCWS